MAAPAALAVAVARSAGGRRLAVSAAVGGVVVMVALSTLATGGAQQAQMQNVSACGDVSMVLDGPPAGGWSGWPTTVPAALTGAEQQRNVAVIVAVGRQLGVVPRGWQIAVATAIQESGLRNLQHGDRDSLGLFQQRPSQGWGTPAQILSPAYAASRFYRGLLAVPDWQQMPLTVAAQTVQRSAFPDAYARWESVARQLVATAGTAAGGSLDLDSGGLSPISQECPSGGANPMILNGGVLGTGTGAAAVRNALTQLGVPYSWGGGGPAGPSQGVAQGASTVGFDCSSLVQFAYWGAGKVAMPRTAAEQYAATRRITAPDLQAGDLLFYRTSTRAAVTHVGIYDGRGGMVHAPRTGSIVHVVPQALSNSYWRAHLVGLGRP